MKNAFSGVRVLNKAVDVLETLRANPAGMTLAGLSGAVALPKPTVYRIVATFESRGYLGRTSDGSYRLSKKMFGLRAETGTQEQLIRVARPAMEELLAICKETLNLGVLDGGEVVVIETLESPRAVRMSSKIGNRRYPHSTALGKVLLAALPERDVLRILRARKLPRFTRATITSERALLVELERVRQQGYAIDNCENELDGRCVAVPVFGAGNNVLAALSVSGPLPRMTMSRARSFVKTLCAAGRSISAGIGGDT
jgi:IclR family KDG regulon transcriptional repressor